MNDQTPENNAGVFDYNKGLPSDARKEYPENNDSEISHTPNTPTGGSNLAEAGFLPVSGSLGGNPAGLIGSNTAVSAPLFTGPTAYNIVGPLTASGGGDAELAQALENAIAEEPTISPATLIGVHIAAAHGIVELSGVAANTHDKARVEAIARRMAGVAEVRNLVTVE